MFRALKFSAIILIGFLCLPMCLAEQATTQESAATSSTSEFHERRDEVALNFAYGAVGATSLYDLTFESPRFAWQALNVRGGIGWGIYDTPATFLSFYTYELGLQLNLVKASTMAMTTYLYIGGKGFIFSDDKSVTGSGYKSSLEVLIGNSWEHTYKSFGNGPVFTGGFYVEGGSSVSTLHAGLLSTDPSIANGFLIRLGLRRYL